MQSQLLATKAQVLKLFAGLDLSDPLPRKGRALLVAFPLGSRYSLLRVERVTDPRAPREVLFAVQLS